MKIVTLLMMLIYCSIPITSFAQDPEDEILLRASELRAAINSYDGKEIRSTMAPWLLRDIGSIEEYDKGISFLASLRLKIGEHKIIIAEEKWAITQAGTSIEGAQEVCTRTLWVKFEGRWYWHETLLKCDYMPNKERIEFLIRGLK